MYVYGNEAGAEDEFFHMLDQELDPTCWKKMLEFFHADHKCLLASGHHLHYSIMEQAVNSISDQYSQDVGYIPRAAWAELCVDEHGNRELSALLMVDQLGYVAVLGDDRLYIIAESRERCVELYPLIDQWY